MGGSLRIAVSRRPMERWSPDLGDHHLDFDICPTEWEELFFDYFGVPEWEAHRKEEDFLVYSLRQKDRFEQHVKERGYPFLARLWHMYDDAGYAAHEVQFLRAECSALKPLVESKRLAFSMIQKLLLACEEAEKASAGLWFLSD